MDKLNQMWKSIYYLVYTEGYSILSVDDDIEEVWLTHETKKIVKRFIIKTPTHQEVDFDFEKTTDHLDDLINEIGFSFEQFDIYYITDKEINLTEFNHTKRPKIRYYALSEFKDYEKVSSHIVTKYQIKKSKTSPVATYRNKLLNASFIDHFMLKFSPVTYALITINIIVWLSLVLVFKNLAQINLVEYGGLVHFNVVHGEWYRLVTHMFLHADFTHLIMNIFSLIIFGKLIEGALGSIKMFTIYMVSGLFAGIVSLSIDTVSISIGASGAIFGLIGAFIVYLFTRRDINKQFVLQTFIGIVILSLMTLFISNVNHFAHLGGFIGGAIMMYIFHSWMNKDKYRLYYILGFILISIIIIIIIYNRQQHHIYDELTKDAMNNGEFGKAEQMITKIKDKHFESDETYILSGLIVANDKSLDEAILEWERGLKVFPQSAPLNYQVALGYRAKNEYGKADKFIHKSLKYDSNNKSYKELQKEIKAFRS
ncbi:rhomboid family protein [Mammaliicoccus stepanovicii]|uniref:Putative membrane peptidase, contains TPR repeat domain n=1 Tax=Mammaliicoccus stepanovicii TaxID=643214 RepID=A0A239Z594_9STAP|nr:rhomboid family intramembrane serine protease [Mammaliicoccus stepanovicii]PNZ72747.1 rhomboid family intramembrane serine protease [Mammaliicoccus stepanovicii]GGI40018.1 rhomboid family intramembrane serine protease [Mammaliicoccus stepanovicii]SNV66541.1 Putative membrane peptidase, contains TPR repeat domain [Mammaliicoccus stepanovicii]